MHVAERLRGEGGTRSALDGRLTGSGAEKVGQVAAEAIARSSHCTCNAASGVIGIALDTTNRGSSGTEKAKDSAHRVTE